MNQEQHSREIVFEGELADVVWDRIKSFPDLIVAWEELESNLDGNYSAETNAKLITLFQTIAFGDDGKHHQKYGSKLGRNRMLASINPKIIGLAIERVSQLLTVNRTGGASEYIDLGFASGGTITYPLSKLGAELYHENRLPPHQFEEPHLESGFSPASAVFIGAMIHLPTIPLLLASHGQFTTLEEPALLCELVASQTVKLLPSTKTVVQGEFGPTLLSENSDLLPVIVTAFSGKGNGELLAVRVGFKNEGRKDRTSDDRRYILDLNDLNRAKTSLDRRYKLLKGWAWFLRLSGYINEANSIEEAASEIRK